MGWQSTQRYINVKHLPQAENRRLKPQLAPLSFVNSCANLHLEFTKSFTVKENIIRKPAQTFKAICSSSVCVCMCEVPNQRWARLGITTKTLSS